MVHTEYMSNHTETLTPAQKRDQATTDKWAAVTKRDPRIADYYTKPCACGFQPAPFYGSHTAECVSATKLLLVR
jgi:hypothetical protein